MAELDGCSVQDGGGNGVWVSGFGGHGSATIRGGWMQDNSKSGVQVTWPNLHDLPCADGLRSHCMELCLQIEEP